MLLFDFMSVSLEQLIPVLFNPISKPERKESVLLNEIEHSLAQLRIWLTTFVKKEEKEETLKEKVKTEEEFTVVEEDEEVNPEIEYSFFENEFIAGARYNAPALDYVKMFYGEDKVSSTKYVQDEEYATQHAPDTEREMMSATEAKELFKDIQYATVTGSGSDVSLKARRNFNTWIMFNKALFNMYQSEAVTSEVNYAAY